MLLARDGATMSGIPLQLQHLRGRPAWVVLSVGGNDLTGHIGLLGRQASSAAEILGELQAIADDFTRRYEVVTRAAAERAERLLLCTIYQVTLEPPALDLRGAGSTWPDQRLYPADSGPTRLRRSRPAQCLHRAERLRAADRAVCPGRGQDRRSRCSSHTGRATPAFRTPVRRVTEPSRAVMEPGKRNTRRYRARFGLHRQSAPRRPEPGLRRC